MKPASCLRPIPSHPLRHEQGLAMLTTVMGLALIALLGIAALTITTMDNQIAGLSRLAHAAATAAESCLGSGVRVVQETIPGAALPASVLDTATPTGPIPTARQTDLLQEIMGQSDQDPDTETGINAAGPDLLQTVGGFSVAGDIDRLYIKPMAGGSAQFGSGSGGPNHMEAYYRVACRAGRATTGTVAQVSAIYLCALTGGDGCRKTTR